MKQLPNVISFGLLGHLLGFIVGFILSTTLWASGSLRPSRSAFHYLVNGRRQFYFSTKALAKFTLPSYHAAGEVQWEVSLRVTGASWGLVIGFPLIFWVEAEFVVFSGTFQVRFKL